MQRGLRARCASRADAASDRARRATRARRSRSGPGPDRSKSSAGGSSSGARKPAASASRKQPLVARAQRLAQPRRNSCAHSSAKRRKPASSRTAIAARARVSYAAPSMMPCVVALRARGCSVGELDAFGQVTRANQRLGQRARDAAVRRRESFALRRRPVRAPVRHGFFEPAERGQRRDVRRRGETPDRCGGRARSSERGQHGLERAARIALQQAVLRARDVERRLPARILRGERRDALHRALDADHVLAVHEREQLDARSAAGIALLLAVLQREQLGALLAPRAASRSP